MKQGIQRLSLWHLAIGWLIRKFYFSSIQVVGAPCSTRPTLWIVSHRNGATDGQVYMQAFGRTPSLISIQLLRHWFLRLMFDGIAVVREKDQQRYGLADAQTAASPIHAAIAQIRAGSSLCLYPEGTSEWQHRPQPYQAGMAVIAARLKAAQADFVVQPAGVFYTKPDGFRSRASIVLGPAFTPQGKAAKAIQEELTAALDQVSVNTASPAAFNASQAQAWAAAQQGTDYGLAFLQAQQRMTTDAAHTNSAIAQTQPTLQTAPQSTLPPSCNTCRGTLAKVCFYTGFPLLTLAAKLAERGADGRNNISFFRLLGGFYGAVLQLALWLALLCLAPWAALLWLAVGLWGWRRYPEPSPVALKEED